MMRRSIVYSIILLAVLAVSGCAREAPATFESVLDQKPKTKLPPFYQPDRNTTGPAMIQNPAYGAEKTP
ncbi:MAG: hypothetical protein HY981_02890 [Candidatus Magasanikbacteria bacterium]|nr:hypothetical protein [Candidatus Magasanikbacteria bacterium]